MFFFWWWEKMQVVQRAFGFLKITQPEMKFSKKETNLRIAALALVFENSLFRLVSKSLWFWKLVEWTGCWVKVVNLSLYTEKLRQWVHRWQHVKITVVSSNSLIFDSASQGRVKVDFTCKQYIMYASILNNIVPSQVSNLPRETDICGLFCEKNKKTYSLILWVIDIPLSWEKNIRQEMHMYAYMLSRIRLFATSRTVAHQAGSLVHGIFQARILEWVAIFYSRQENFLFDNEV